MDDECLVPVNGVELCVQTFGEPTAPPVLLIGNTLLTWPDELCERLARTPRRVVRYDLRDTGRSTTIDPGTPGYTLRDLVADAAGLLAALGLPRAHVAGFGVGGWIAQLLALDHPDRVAALTLIATRPNPPGPVDADLPEHDPELMRFIISAPQPDWTDRASVVAAMADKARHMAGRAGFDEAAARERAGRIFDRAVVPLGADPATVHRSNQLASAFAAMDSGDRWRERLGGIGAPTVVIHGEDDPFFPIGNGQALAREIPGAELIRLPGTGQELPPRVWDKVIAALARP
ncbi:alpha/beta fold hydrolase [Actinomadura rudentiformis]|uniref:alpha/beta fold hydrolase n=1 Tax=Actinomadura rudentiformis TaxID=359158 RepID=UPI001CEFA1E4|nr:alpha/beta hydrolase [Actinomadura rudentiformis]